MEKIKHWAETLQIGDRVKGTIRHKTDGSKNIINADMIIVDNSISTNEVTVWCGERPKKVKVPYNELSPTNQPPATV